ncbi:hypothetical protein ACFQZ4_42790 [Catellatospora coxensis]|uniref:Uncharacterized protein n=1 Tax=Catellatospora coxensis TaxID=310354 RepID=A0A8J3P841_9ACTN|nr:hypothetical protein [Catellatospora coxensis]GIG07159.1 hypothetical protein Cco03nite_38590 [Catellatospora coxensis]
MEMSPQLPRPQPRHPVAPYEVEVRVLPVLAVVETLHSLDQAEGEACLACGARGVDSARPHYLDTLVPVGRERRRGTVFTAHRECLPSWLARWFREGDELKMAHLNFYHLRQQVADELLGGLEQRLREYGEQPAGKRPSREVVEWECAVIREAALSVRFGDPDER